MSSKATSKNSYPENLITAVFGQNCNCAYYDINIVNEVIKSFDERDQEIIRLRYEEKMNYAKIGAKLGLSSTRITQLDYRFRYYARIRYACYLVDHKVGIDKLGIPTRYANVLKKNGIETIYDLLGYDKNSLLNLKGIGEVSFKEIVRAIDAQYISTHRFK